MNGVDDNWPATCLSIFPLINIPFAVSTACLKSSMGNYTQYNLVGSVFLNNSKICVSP